MNHFIARVLSLLIFSTAAVADYIPGEYVVQLKSKIKVESNEAVQRLLGGTIIKKIPHLNIVLIRRPAIENAQYVIESILKSEFIESIEPNYIFEITKTPNDSLWEEQWHLKNRGQPDANRQFGTPGIDIGAEAAWDIETGSENTIIAVIDTGIDVNHPDLEKNIWINNAEMNGRFQFDDDNNGYIDDIYGINAVDESKITNDILDDEGHGTHCAGIIGAEPNNKMGIAGINWKTKLMPIKIFNKDGKGTLIGAITGIDYAIKMGARVINASWSGKVYSEQLEKAFERAHQANILTIAAAGNSGENLATNPEYPAAFDVKSILSVAAVNNYGELALFSNYGKKFVHVAAPGSYILSTIPGSYAVKSGTSMAAPVVSGIAGLLISQNPQLTNLKIKEKIISTVQPINGLKSMVQASGMANAYRALANILAPTDPDDPKNWKSMSVSISSAHPYLPKTKKSFEVQIPGAKQISLYLLKLETERGYDPVKIFDKTGKLISQLSGVDSDVYSPLIDGDYVKIEFTTDDVVEKYGFDITKAAYR